MKLRIWLGRLSAVGILCLVGCRREPRTPLPLSDDGFERSSSASATNTVPPFDRFGEFPTLTVVSRLRSGHPVGSYVGRVRVDEAASSYGQKARPAMPEGALVVEELAPDAEGGASLFYVMVKRSAGYFPDGADWEYMVLGPGGDVQARGKIALCARCHGEAPREHLFEQLNE